MTEIIFEVTEDRVCRVPAAATKRCGRPCITRTTEATLIACVLVHLLKLGQELIHRPID